MASGIGKRVVNQIKILGGGAGGRRSTPIPGTTARWVQASSYDKNPDDQIQTRTVPDDVIQPESDKYWGPNPKTGVFGPSDKNGVIDSHVGDSSSSSPSLDLPAWFRPQEDVQKPPPSHT